MVDWGKQRGKGFNFLQQWEHVIKWPILCLHYSSTYFCYFPYNQKTRIFNISRSDFVNTSSFTISTKMSCGTVFKASAAELKPGDQTATIRGKHSKICPLIKIIDLKRQESHGIPWGTLVKTCDIFISCCLSRLAFQQRFVINEFSFCLCISKMYQTLAWAGLGSIWAFCNALSSSGCML